MGKPHIVIVGGGISGLATALYLSREASPRVTVLEGSDRWGGVLRTLRSEAFSIEAAADTFDGSRPEALDLCAGLGLSAELAGSEPSLKNVSIRFGRRTFPVPFSARVLASGALDLSAKVRMVLGSWIPRKITDADESLEGFLLGRFGLRFLEQIAGPLIRGVMMAEPGELSAREYFPESSTGNKVAGKAWTLRGGMDRLVTTLTEHLQNKAALRLQSVVQAVTRAGSWRVILENGEILEADGLCLALPAFRSAGLLRDAAPALSQALSGIRYDSVAVVNLIFCARDIPPEWKRPGFIVPGPGESWPFSSLKLVGADSAGSQFRVKIFISGVLHKIFYDLPDEALAEKIKAALKAEWNIPEPAWSGVERYPRALAQYGPGHRERISEIERALRDSPGLYLAGNGYRGFGITDCIREGRCTAAKIRTSFNCAR